MDKPKNILIVGAGFSGLYQLHCLRDKLKLNTLVLEEGDGLGGTWYWNRYPGARCDSESFTYGYTFSKKIFNNWTWKERYPKQNVILRYLKYFSRETHTIYPPKLEVVWDDSSWNSGSLSALSATDLERLKIYFKNLRPEYKEKSIVKFRIVGRELYPTTSFATTPAELDVKYLPSASTEYEIRDAETEEVIVPFGSGSRVSCDTTGNFFRVQMDGLQAERNYRFCLKVVSGSGTTDEEINFYDDNYEFRVVR